ncbi:MBL fold metallo-hydrolase [Thalassorhabdus alkalitolerans]|uniref:MBL fold metallo-hydrolase n=1 Tax=Thalassorhabdus alkalitolerans TaxID=2282697 RepID=A0ABW0YKI8_9BACI
MKITVIGYWHGYPGAGEATSGYLFEEEGYKMLVDCGSGVVSSLQQYIDLKDLDSVVLSHYHNDHIADIGVLHYHRVLSYYGEGFEKPLTIYGHQEDSQGFSALSYKNLAAAFPYTDQAPLMAGPFTITFVKTSHPVACYGMRISTEKGSVFYTADTGYMPALASHAQHCDLMIAECSLFAGQDGTAAGHMNSHEAGKLADAAKAKELLLTHLPHFGNHKQLVSEAKEYFQGNVETAHAGWKKTIEQ